MKDLENKIIKKIGKEYHFSTTYGFSKEMNELEIVGWKLYRKYDDLDIYFSKDNKPIMTSETNTLEEVYKYVKSHKKIDEHKVVGNACIIISFIVFLISILNIFFNNPFIRGFIFGADLTVIIIVLISHYIWNKNWKVNMKFLRENFNKRFGSEKDEPTSCK